MIKEISLKFGSKYKDNPLKFSPGSVTIFVGPNNSGKSLLLREIENFCTTGSNKNNLILENLEFYFSDNQIQSMLNYYTIPKEESKESDIIRIAKINSTKGLLTHTVNPQHLIQWKNNKSSYEHFCRHFISLFSARFSGKERFNLVSDTPHGDLKSAPTSNLMALFQDDIMRNEVRELIYQAFGKYFVIDPTNMGKLQIRLSDVNPPSSQIERGWNQESANFHKNATHIQEFSDGVQAFTGLVLATTIGNEKYIFIDEPEAFLHPHLSSLLGKKLSDLMSRRDGNLIVSTHSPHFVMGCIQSGKNVNIVRLTYDGNKNATARLLPSDKINELFKNPLLRSTGTIQALFFDNVIVSESDTDRAFYNEINERMLSHSRDSNQRGINNSLFINAQNKQTIWTIIKPLRELGIPSAAITDIDILKDGGKEFTRLLNAAQIPVGLHETMQNLRNLLKLKFAETSKCMKRDGGISLLNEEDKKVFKKFISDFKENGIFILENGELESWLVNLDCKGHGPSWLISVFTAMGDNPEQENYIRPSDDDVWLFMDEINEWFKKPMRKGIN